MKPESQHLDFLISQYVDGCLEGANKKSVEQQLLTDPAARKLYDEHREVQDLLDDWGNRIPLINWDEFDQKLATKLAQENVGVSKYSIFRRWVRPVAAAAALFVAAIIGYSVGGLGPKTVVENPVVVTPQVSPHNRVTFTDLEGATQPSHRNIAVVEPEAARGTPGRLDPRRVVVSRPSDAIAKDVVEESVAVGLGNLSDSQKKLLNASAGGVAVSPSPQVQQEAKPDVAFP